MEIKGVAENIVRVHVKAPADKVHQTDKNGRLKGCHSMILNGKLIPRGRVKLYYQKDEEVGVQVYYSMAWKKAQKIKYVRRMFRKQNKLHALGLSPPAEKIIRVKINLLYRNTRHKADAYGIRTRHIHYPIGAWKKYMEGYPYEWYCLDQTEHPDHNPKGFLRFAARVKRKMKAHGLSTSGSLKLGDILYCTKRKRYFYVDIDD